MPAPALNGYALENHFRKLRSRWRFTPLEHYLFSELVALCNEEGWPADFNATNATLAAGLGCSEKGLISARKKLVEAGLISCMEGQNRRPTSYRFCLLEGLPTVSVSLGKPLPEALPEVSNTEPETPEHLPEHLPQGLPEVSPYKEQTKTKKKVCAKLENEASPKPLPFEEFWAAYDKKTGRLKSCQKWATLSPDEQAAVLAHLPGYVAATPDKQFRKDAATYLHNRTWEDEELPPPRGGQQPTPVASLPSPRPAPELNAAFLAEQAAREAAEEAAHFAKYAVAA